VPARDQELVALVATCTGWLGTKWESPALVTALYRSILLTCARASPAEIGKCPGGGNVDAFLGVKWSPISTPSQPTVSEAHAAALHPGRTDPM